MDNEHAVFRENIPAYALGALDAAEAAALRTHLLTCESCRRELAEYQAVGESLQAALPPQQPPAALRRRLRERIQPAPKTTRPRLAWSFGQLAAGAVLLILLAFNILSFVQVTNLQRQQATLLRQVQTDQAALAMLSYPDTQSLAIESQQVSGSFLIDREHNAAMLIVWNMPALPQNQTYQAWLVQPDGVRVSAGTFGAEEAAAYTAKFIRPNQSLSTFTALGVTVEPAGGSPQPTGARLLKVNFQAQ